MFREWTEAAGARELSKSVRFECATSVVTTEAISVASVQNEVVTQSWSLLKAHASATLLLERFEVHVDIFMSVAF